jgi:hypothetical protein
MKNNNKKEEILFQIDLITDEYKNQSKSRKIVKSAEKNIKKMLFNRLKGQTGEC